MQKKTQKKIIKPIDLDKEKFNEELMWLLRKHKISMMVYAVIDPLHTIHPAVIASSSIPEEVKSKVVDQTKEALIETLEDWEAKEDDDSNLDDEVLT